MENFKFGHRVLVRDKDDEKWQKGRFVYYYPDDEYCYSVLVDSLGYSEGFIQCRLDLEATEFVIGDEVWVRDFNDKDWKKAIYAGLVGTDTNKHYAAKKTDGTSVTFFDQCRYPKPAEQSEPAQIIELNGRKYEIREVQE